MYRNTYYNSVHGDPGILVQVSDCVRTHSLRASVILTTCWVLY